MAYRSRQWIGAGGLVLGVILTASVGAAGQAKAGIFGDPSIWQWAPSRSYHVGNYKLKLRFDEPQGEVFGDEVVTLQPFESHFHRFYLDSSELKILSVTLEPLRGSPVKLPFAVQDSRLWITLDREYGSTSTLNVRIVYRGRPRTGLFFINPDSNYPSRPREVYSQGEPEFNHYWFPCWDYPNDLATSETVTTVPEGQSVVSNGKLVKVTHSAGHITYDWVESIPHSSYLISIAVGPWRKVEDQYGGKPVDYYVPNSVDENTARRSFHLTPDMIGFFSHATGVPYPYEQYAQTTVHNFIFGGQENVSATTLTDVTLHNERAEQDYPSTNLVSHELGQHWFGNFVQGRDWANIWLNEGFATYLEALYTQYHEGNDAFRFEIFNDQLTEQAQDHNDYRRPIVDRHYTDPLQMFDAITHEKGSAVLDMMRYVLDGADGSAHPAWQRKPFFRALHYYLTTHHAQTADTADLLNAIWTTTGQDLTWFFHEWVFMAGHPDYRIEANYDAARRIEKVNIAQTQVADELTPIFDMPIELAFYGAHGERKEIQVRNNSRQQEFDIPLDFEPQWVDFDPNDFIDKTVQFDKPLEALVAQAKKDPSMMSRLWAVEQLGRATLANQGGRIDVLGQVLGADGFYGVRAAAARSLADIGTDQAKTVLFSALQQPDSRVRTAVVEGLSNFVKEPAVYSALVKALHDDSSYAVEAAAAKVLGKSGIAQAFDVLRIEVQTKPEIHVMQATLSALAATKDPRAAEILLAQAQPGVPERIRLYALGGLKSMKEPVSQNHAQDLVEVVRAALHDPFYSIQEVGEQLVGVFDLSQFEADIRAEAQGAPMAMQREAAQKVLDQLHHQ